MNKLTNFLLWLSWLFRKIPTTTKAEQMGLTHYTNIHGDMINHTGCRSFWQDKNGRIYGCKELFKGGKDIVIDSIVEQLKTYK